VENGTERFDAYSAEHDAGEIANERRLADFDTGLNTTRFCVAGVEALGHLAVKVSIELRCDTAVSPWCVQERDAASDEGAL